MNRHDVRCTCMLAVMLGLGLQALMATSPVRAAQVAGGRYVVYVSLGGADALATFKLDPTSGELTPAGEAKAGGAPGAQVVDTQRANLYAAIRSINSVATFRIDSQSGKLTLAATTPVVENPVYLAIDKSGRHLLTSYYSAAKAAVYPIGKDGIIGDKASSIVVTDKNPHSILPDPSGKYAFVPNTGADKVLQYRFDDATGTLTANAQPQVMIGPGTGPRHFYFHPGKNFVYFVNEKGSSVTACSLNAASGTLSAMQTISTLPQDSRGNNTCAHIEITPNGKFLYASNRGHDSLAIYSIDSTTGKLSSLGNQATEKTPRSFNIDPSGNFLIAAGQASDKLAVYRIDPASGKLQPLAIYAAGKGPAWVQIVKLP